MWLWLNLISGILLGFYEIFKKKALEKSSLLNVLAMYSLVSFLIVGFEIQNALRVDYRFIVFIFIKSLIIFFSWILGFIAIRSMPISVSTPLANLTPVFTVLLGVLALHEHLGYLQVAGVIIILTAYYFIGKTGAGELDNLFGNKYFYLTVGSTFLSAVSALIDKIALKTVNTGQMQFWFCFFLALLYFGAFFLSTIKEKQKRSFKIDFTIVLMSIFLVASDRLYFNAVGSSASQIAVILPLRRTSVLVSSIWGGIIFKEKNLLAKFWCVCVVILGIVLVFLGK
jgi:bacterial/archaeal transporter family protein